MSMSYSSRTTPRSSASQGRIHTENTALSAILREKSNGNIAPAQRTAQQEDEQDTYRDRQQEPDRLEPHRSDLADELKVPYPFDTQAVQGADTAREPKPPSPPVQTTPPPNKEPATSLRSNSNVYAVANPEVLRAQGIEPETENNYVHRQYSNSEARQSRHSAVRFDSGSRRPPSIDSRTYGGSPVKERVPTPYAKSPEREELPKTPPEWEIPKEEKSREQSNISKRSLPPQHPPLDTLHSSSKPGSRGTRRTQDDNQSIKRVYVESPSFTKEEEEEYRFVSSRLEDTEDQKQRTHREMDNSRRGYGGDDNPMHSYSDNRSHNRDSYAGNSYPDNRSRKTDNDYTERNRGYDKDRYEDRNQDKYSNKNQDRNGDEFYKDGYEDRHHELNGYYDERKSRDKHREGDRYRDRVKESEHYDRADRYERLRDERAEYEKEPRREDEMEYRQGYRKQNTEMDERDLQKEAEYQRDLKRRIDKQSVKMKSDRYEKERLEKERFEKERYDKENDYRRDSLEYPSDDRDGGYVQDSLEYNNYDPRQQEWENPPQNPYQDNQGYYPDGFIKQDSKPDFYDADDVERMDIVNPKAPKYDYVEQNKQDYGKNPRRSYRDIVHKKKEEEQKLDHIFISPKVPSKASKKKHKKAQSAQPEHMGYQAPDQYPLGFKPSSAEELWAQRARVLSEKKGSAGSGKPAKQSASKSVPRWNSNPQVKQAQKFEPPAPLANQGQFYKPTGAYHPSSAQDQGGYSQPQGGYSTPTRQLQPLENRPAAPASTEMVPTAVNPSSPFRRHMELKPISQEITTEDGQRISVDINLRLISPPPGQSGMGSPTQQQLALVPVQETQGLNATGIPYQMQDAYGNYDGYNTGYSEGQMVQYNNGYQTQPVNGENQYTSEELALVDPTGYSKKYQPGSVSFRDDTDNSDLKSLEEGYAAAYHKMKSKDPSEHPWYKIYNINDYKKMQREVRLNRGTLGPDLDTESYKDKMEKRHKQFEYARMVMEKNRMELGHKKPPKFPRQPEKQGEEGAKRKTALEYAKNVPKPVVKPRPNQYNSYEVAAQLTPGGSSNKVRSPTKPTPPPTQTVDVIDIRTLEQRHLQERQKTDKIRQNMDSVLSQKAH
ncbi:mediator of RNA polymerase II transcription subunit 12-like isoform X2 [Mercenaria mercenaria]|uniref:mediator of RNA polymerase II transcription subunit 12-like isoform X2 n=1 Tax=Mercenaria mercenaria TaxID=6596 RepID=UPI00234F6150|nr:mediator of RNA polymerase II transcription subunit 12-like isoform X2 [Mercenaria mercenaria]